MPTPDPYDALLAEIGKLLRGEGHPVERYALAKSISVMMTVNAAQAVADTVAQAGTITAAAEMLEISPQAVSQTLAKHGHASPNRPGRPKTKLAPKETEDVD